MKHIYDEDWHKRNRTEIWVGICTTVFIGFCIAFNLGCTRPKTVPALGHVHEPVCWHINPQLNKMMPCTFPYDEVKDSELHCDFVKCNICGKFMKKP